MQPGSSRPQTRHATGVVTLLVVTVLCGCARSPRASMDQLFSRHPDKPATDTALDEEPGSTVVANTATPVVTSEDSLAATVTEPQKNSSSPIVEEITEGPHLAVNHRATADEPRHERERPIPKIWDRRMMSAAAENTVHRLKRALSADSDNTQTTADGTAQQQQPVRVRVDGLVQEAEELLESGDLQDAKVVAERAADLAATVALDYLPNEERPDDLLQKIVAAIDDRDRAPIGAGEVTGAPILALPADAPVEDSTSERPFSLEIPAEITPSRSVVAANRPALLSTPLTEITASAPASLVEMSPVLGELNETPEAIDPVTAVGLAAPLATGNRLRQNRDAGPLLGSPEARPVLPQIAEVSPLPAYTATAAPRAENLATDAPKFTFLWNDLWPLWGLAIVIGIVGGALLMRRLVTGH